MNAIGTLDGEPILVITHKSVRSQLHCGRRATVQLSPERCGQLPEPIQLTKPEVGIQFGSGRAASVAELKTEMAAIQSGRSCRQNALWKPVRT